MRTRDWLALILFPGIGKDNSNILLLLIGTVLMLVSLVVLWCGELRS